MRRRKKLFQKRCSNSRRGSSFHWCGASAARGRTKARARFDLWLRLQLAQFGMKDAFPPEGLVYDYVRSRGVP